MPLAPGSDSKTVSANIAEMVKAGHPQDQAVAAALRNAGQSTSKKHSDCCQKCADGQPCPRMLKRFAGRRQRFASFCGGKGSGRPGPCPKGADKAHIAALAHAKGAHAKHATAATKAAVAKAQAAHDQIEKGKAGAEPAKAPEKKPEAVSPPASVDQHVAKLKSLYDNFKNHSHEEIESYVRGQVGKLPLADVKAVAKGFGAYGGGGGKQQLLNRIANRITDRKGRTERGDAIADIARGGTGKGDAPQQPPASAKAADKPAAKALAAIPPEHQAPLKRALKNAAGDNTPHALALQLANAETETHPAHRGPIRDALKAAGATPIDHASGKEGFVSRLHASDQPLFPGDPVKVTEPGWMAHDAKGEYLLRKAKVESAAGKPEQAKPAAPKAHQLTREEWEQHLQKTGQRGQYGLGPRGLAVAHRTRVASALAGGLNVPEKVKSQYPDVVKNPNAFLHTEHAETITRTPGLISRVARVIKYTGVKIGRKLGLFSEGGKLASVPDVEIFASGTHRGKTYTDADLDQMAANFQRFSTGKNPLLQPPVVLGHEETQDFLDDSGLPAAGWVKHVYREGHILKASFGQVPPVIAKAIERRAYRKVSAEVYDDFELPNGKTVGKALRRVALLGGEIPQVKNLSDLPEPVYSEGGTDYLRLPFRVVDIQPSKTRGCFVAFSEFEGFCGGKGGKPGPCAGAKKGVKAPAAKPAAKPKAALKPKAAGPSMRPHKADDSVTRMYKTSHAQATAKAQAARAEEAGHRKAFEAARDKHEAARKELGDYRPIHSGNQATAKKALLQQQMAGHAKTRDQAIQGMHSARQAAEAHEAKAAGHQKNLAAYKQEQAVEKRQARKHSELTFEVFMDHDAMIQQLTQLGYDPDKLQTADDDLLQHMIEVAGGDSEDMDDEDEGGDQGDEGGDDTSMMDGTQYGDDEPDADDKPGLGNPAPGVKPQLAVNPKGSTDTSGDTPMRPRKVMLHYSEIEKMVTKAVTAAVAKVDQRLNQAEKFTEETHQRAKKELVEKFVEEHSLAGRIPPAQKEKVKSRLLRTDSVNVVHRFKEKGKEVALTEFDLQCKEIAESPVLRLFQEKVKGANGKGAAEPDVEVEKVEQHWDTYAERFNNLNTPKTELVEAFKLRQKREPGLTAERFLAVR